MTHIKIKNISKKYIISPFKTMHAQRSLRDDIVKHLLTPTTLFLKNVSHSKDRFSQKPVRGNLASFLSVFKKMSRRYFIKTKTKEVYWALKDISLTFKEGDIVGIIGKNGSGKSTLLKIIAGITPPTSGEISIKGTITTLLGIGVGFHTDLTGKENVFLNGTLLGFKKKDLEKEFTSIVAFSGIEKFINTPVKFYSSGMYARLAFSVVTSSCNTADIFLIDEVLAVGDEEFKQKSLARIKELSQQKKKIILLVSHERSLIEMLCTKCLWLESGKIKAYGKPQEILTRYAQSVQKENHN